MVRVAILGAAGRMGRNLIAAFASSETCEVKVAVDCEGHPLLGQDSGIIAGVGENHIPLTADVREHADQFDIAIDFTIPEASLENARVCAQLGKCLAIGTTGLTLEQTDQLNEYAQRTPILFAPNMSVGVNLCFKLLEFATKILGESADIEIIEAHHKHKIDAPSGTALKMGEIVAHELGRDLNHCAIYGREGRTGVREPNTIGFETIRAGDIVGEHTVMFASEGERIEITHKATSRMNFAQGAVRAASWLVSQSPGLYDMQDVLELKLSS